MSKGGGGGGPSEQTVIQSNLPEYAEPFYRSLLARVGYESALPYEAYPGQRLAYFSPAEQEAQRRFEQLGVSGTPSELLAAGDIAAQVGQGNPYVGTMLGGQYQAQDAALSYMPTQGTTITSALPTAYTAGSFTDPTTVETYMNPYQQLVVDQQKEEARRQSDIMGQQASLQAAGSGSLGGYREAIMQAERERNLADQLDQIQAEAINNSVPGFTTSSKTRPLIVAKLEEFIRNKLINIYSSRVVNEFKTFIWHNNRAQAMRSYHDDLVMALAIGCWVRDTALEKKDLEYKMAMINSFKLSKGKFQTTIPGMTGHRAGPYTDDQRKIKKQYEDFVWLIKG